MVSQLNTREGELEVHIYTTLSGPLYIIMYFVVIVRF